MARPRRSRVELHRSRLDEMSLAVADGFGALAEAIVEEAGRNAPDSPLMPYPTGEGLPKQGGWLVWVGGKQVVRGSLSGQTPKKPRAVRVGQHGIVAVAGFGFPARFQEVGTVRHRAQPFFTPAADRTLPRATEIIAPVVRGRLGSRP